MIFQSQRFLMLFNKCFYYVLLNYHLRSSIIKYIHKNVLHIACESKNTELVKYIISEKSIDINSKDISFYLNRITYIFIYLFLIKEKQLYMYQLRIKILKLLNFYYQIQILM